MLMAAILVASLVYARVLGTERLHRMTTAAERLPAPPEVRSLGSGVRFAHHTLSRPTRMLAFAYLLLPIAVVVAFSFNDPAGTLQLHVAGLHAATTG